MQVGYLEDCNKLLTYSAIVACPADLYTHASCGLPSATFTLFDDSISNAKVPSRNKNVTLPETSFKRNHFNTYRFPQWIKKLYPQAYKIRTHAVCQLRNRGL